MKKIITLLFALSMVLCLTACNKKVAEKDDNASVISQTQNISTVKDINDDPAEYSIEFWAKKYPGKNICPFYIEEGGAEKPYYLVMEMGCSMEEWIKTPFNWNGWHKIGSDIVNKDETYKMTTDWVNEENFSSGCTVKTEPYKSAV